MLSIIATTLLVVVSAAISALVWTVHFSNASAVAATAPPIISTPIGRFVGVVTVSKMYGSSYVMYKSIPFAQPPIGELRFKPPQPIENTDRSQPVNSDQYQKSCWTVTRKSTDPNYGEDCLYLNVYVPGTGETVNSQQQLPVMVWIHGGGFVAGSTFPEPEKLVIRGNVIVVTINYRLGVFGFLTTQDNEFPSNNGLWDQIMAIEWVKNNINFFQGDASSITIFGESSGAISAALHAISPISSPLFNKVILQSGGATSLISRNAKQRAKDFAYMVGCSSAPSGSIHVECLRQVSVADVLKFSKPSAFNISLGQQQIDFIWMPVVDENIIPAEPLNLLSNVTYLKKVGVFEKDFLIGVLNNEGALIPDNFLNPIPLSTLSDVGYVKQLTDYLVHGRYGLNYSKSEELERRIYSFYTGSSLLSPAPHPQSIMDLAGDITFVIPAVELALALSRCHKSDTPSCSNNSVVAGRVNCNTTAAKTYLYHFDYCPETDICTASCMAHGADVAYEFPRANFTDTVQQQLSDSFVDILTTFAKSSNPGTVVKCGWPTFETSTQSYLRLDSFPSVRQYLYDNRINFWLKQVPT